MVLSHARKTVTARCSAQTLETCRCGRCSVCTKIWRMCPTGCKPHMFVEYLPDVQCAVSIANMPMHVAGNAGGVAAESATAWGRQCHSSADERADLFDVQSQLTGTPEEDLRQLTTSVEMCPTSVLASACLVAQRKDGWHMMPRSKQQRNSTNVSHILLSVRVECSITCV